MSSVTGNLSLKMTNHSMFVYLVMVSLIPQITQIINDLRAEPVACLTCHFAVKDQTFITKQP